MCLNSEPLKKQFLKEYCNFMSRLGERMNSRAWWSTWLSSRNRFQSTIVWELEKIFAQRYVRQGELKNYTPVSERATYPLRVFLKTLFFAGQMVVSIFSAKLYLSSRKKTILNHIEAERADRQIYLVKTFSYDHSFADEQRIVTQ